MSAGSSGTNRPRVLIVAPSAYPLGGVATWLDGLVAGLRARGWELELALLAGYHHDVDRYLERHPLGAVRRIENRSGSREGRLRALERAIRASDAQLVLSVNVGDIEDAIDRTRRRGLPSVQCVTTQHGLQRDFYEHLRARAETVDGVIVTNRLSVEIARDVAGMEPARVAYAPYGVELKAAPTLKTDHPSLRIAWVGRLEERQKRARDLVAVVAELARRGTDFRLTVAGSGPEEERLRAALSNFVADGRVVFTGELGSMQLDEQVYASHDVLLVTSNWETGPIVAWEALAAGMAVVSSAFLGIGREGALRHQKTALLFPIGDTDSAVNELARLRDPGIRERLIAAGRDEVRRRYTLSTSLDAWEGALLQIAAVESRAASSRTLSVPSAGRLDRLLGPSRAETIRRQFRIEHRQAAPGDEWPHALISGGDEAEFLRLAAELDRGSGEAEDSDGA